MIFFNVFQKKTVVIEDNLGALGNAVTAQMKREMSEEPRRAPAAHLNGKQSYPTITVEAEA